ncbi:MAG: amidoligase family protein [Pseudomonas neustonica]
MPSKPTALNLPPLTKTAEGAQRRVGVELEMNGLELGQLSALVAEHCGCTIEQTSRYERTLKGDPAGDWIVELDSALLKKMGRTERPEDPTSAELVSSAEDAIMWVAESLVPYELVSPPLPLDRLNIINELIALLRDAGAKGTADRLTNAFGMQFNPEVPATDARTLTAYLKAFLCLYDWINQRASINFARRVTTYVDPFPGAYVRKVTATDYWPDLPTLIDDYLLHNPTRNRALDMLPLFRHLDEPRVLAHTQDELIKPRPTFHYRLPDCLIDQPGWDLTPAWNDWLEVEKLANDHERLQGCCGAYQTYLGQGIGRLLDSWPEHLTRNWLPDVS